MQRERAPGDDVERCDMVFIRFTPAASMRAY